MPNTINIISRSLKFRAMLQPRCMCWLLQLLPEHTSCFSVNIMLTLPAEQIRSKSTLTQRNILLVLIIILLTIPSAFTQTAISDIFLFGNYLRYLTTDSNSDHRTAVNEFNSMLVAEERKSKKPQNGISFTPRQTPARDKDNISTIYNYGSDGPLNAGYIMTHDKDKLMEFLNEAQYNLTTHVMSNGIKVIIASDIGKPPIVTKTTATEVASKNSLHEKLRLRIGSRKAAYSRATTLAPSTLKDQMILVQPSKWISPTKFSLPYNLNQFVTKTCFTTYTYRTTYLQNGSPTVESREQVISNIATEKRNYLRMAPLISLGVILSQTPSFAIEIFPTTYSYYNTILDADHFLVQISKRTIINTVTGSNGNVHFLQPSEDATPAYATNTYYRKITFRNESPGSKNTDYEIIATTTNILTQVVVTESLASLSPIITTLVKASNALNNSEYVSKNELKTKNFELITKKAPSTNYREHIYTTQTFLTTHIYSKTALASVTDCGYFDKKHEILPTNISIQKSTLDVGPGQTQGLQDTEHAIINYHTRITEAVPSILLNSELVSKLREDLKNLKSERRTIIPTPVILNGQTLKTTAERTFEPTLWSTASPSSEKKITDIAAYSIKNIPSTILPTKFKHKLTLFNYNVKSTEPSKGTWATAVVKSTSFILKSTTPKVPKLASVKQTKNSNGITLPESDNEKNSFDPDSEYDLGHVNEIPASAISDKAQSPQQQLVNTSTATNTNNKNHLPIAVNQLIDTINFQHLNALRPVLNAAAGLLQYKNLKNASFSNLPQSQQRLPQMQSITTSPALSLTTAAVSQIPPLNLKPHGTPMYIPVNDIVINVKDGSKTPTFAAFTEGATAALLDAGSAQSLQIHPPREGGGTIDADEDNWLLHWTANEIYPQLYKQDIEYNNRIAHNFQKFQNSDGKIAFNTLLINAGIPISPGEVITANSDIIIGTPNGIQFPRLPPLKKNFVGNVGESHQYKWVEKNMSNINPKQYIAFEGHQVALTSFNDKSLPHLSIQKIGITHQQVQRTPMLEYGITFLLNTLHQKQQQKLGDYYLPNKRSTTKKYDNMLWPPPPAFKSAISLTDLNLQPLSPLTPLPWPEEAPSTNSINITYSQTLSILTPPALPSVAKNKHKTTHSITPTRAYLAEYEAYESHLKNKVRAYLQNHPPTLGNYPMNNNNTVSHSMEEQFITGNKKSKHTNLYNLTLYTPKQYFNYYREISNAQKQYANSKFQPQENQPQQFQESQAIILRPYSYSVLNATQRISGRITQAPRTVPVPGMPTHAQNINLHTNVFNHNVNMHAPPLTFKKEMEYPTQAIAVHGQIPNVIEGTVQHLPYGISHMPHIKIPHNKEEVQVYLTPQNVIRNIGKPNVLTNNRKGTKNAEVIHFENAAGTIDGSFSLDNTVQMDVASQHQQHQQRQTGLLRLSIQKKSTAPCLKQLQQENNKYFKRGKNNDRNRHVNTYQRILIPTGSETAFRTSLHHQQYAPPFADADNHMVNTNDAAKLYEAYDKEDIRDEYYPVYNTGGEYNKTFFQYNHEYIINKLYNAESTLSDYKENLDKNAPKLTANTNIIVKKAEVRCNGFDNELQSNQNAASVTNNILRGIQRKQQLQQQKFNKQTISFSPFPQRLKNQQQHILQPLLSANAVKEVNDPATVNKSASIVITENGSQDKLIYDYKFTTRMLTALATIEKSKKNALLYAATGDGFKSRFARPDSEVMVNAAINVQQQTHSSTKTTLKISYIKNSELEIEEKATISLIGSTGNNHLSLSQGSTTPYLQSINNKTASKRRKNQNHGVQLLTVSTTIREIRTAEPAENLKLKSQTHNQTFKQILPSYESANALNFEKGTTFKTDNIISMSLAKHIHSVVQPSPAQFAKLYEKLTAVTLQNRYAYSPRPRQKPVSIHKSYFMRPEATKHIVRPTEVNVPVEIETQSQINFNIETNHVEQPANREIALSESYSDHINTMALGKLLQKQDSYVRKEVLPTMQEVKVKTSNIINDLNKMSLTSKPLLESSEEAVVSSSITEQEEKQHHGSPLNKRILLLTTKYMTRTQLIPVTTISSTVLATTATEVLQKMILFKTRTQTATVIKIITHIEWETDTKVAKKIATSLETKTQTKTHMQTYVQSTRIIESHATATKMIGVTERPEQNNVKGPTLPSSDNEINAYNRYYRREQLEIDSNNNHNENENNKRIDNKYNIDNGYSPIAAENKSTLPAILPGSPNYSNMESQHNNIFIVMGNSHNGGKGKSTSDSPQSESGIDDTGTNATTIKLDYDDTMSMLNMPTRDEELIATSLDLDRTTSQILLGGKLIDTLPKVNIHERGNHANNMTCQPKCKTTRSEVCALLEQGWLCICRPGFARMFPDRPCTPTYTYTLRIPASRIGDHKLHYERLLRDNTTNDYKQLSTITKEAVDRLVMQSDFRDIYHGVQLTAFSPIVGIIKHMEIKANVEPTGISANFLLQLSENIGENRLTSVFKKYLRQSNYSIGGTELYTNRNDVKLLAIKDFNECDDIQFHDCSPNARCFNLQGTYTCCCEEGYADLSCNTIYPGRICSSELLGCEQCHHHGKCTTQQTDHGDYTVCECFAWYTGYTCKLNLKILLIGLMAIGTLLFTLLLFCVLLMYTKRHHTIRKKPRPLSQCSTGIHRIIIAKNSALAGIGVNKGNSTHGITRDRSKWINHDKCSIINYTSSESSKNTLPHILKETMPGSKKSCHPSRDYLNEHPPQAEGNIVDTTGTEKHSLIAQNSFTHLERSYPEQGDQSLTVMIPRAKYHASVLPQMQLFHQQVANERSKKKRDYPHYNKSDDTTLMSIRQDNICNIMQHPINVLSRITSKKLDINRTNQPKATPTFGILCNDDCEVANMHMRQLGALVSAGFEVSAIVGENILNKSSSTTSAQCSTIMSLDDNSIDAVGFKSFDSQPKNNETNVAAQTKLTLSEKPRHQYQQITQSKLGFDNEGEHHSIQNDVVIYQGDNRFN